MKIFPAIDIKDKKCVRLIKGDFNNKTIYNQSPLEQAKIFKDYGFKNIHIVDLDGALTGQPININLIELIINKLGVNVEVGGGIRSIETIERYIKVGVEKVILGSIAIKAPVFFKEVCAKYKNKIALAIDERQGNLAVSGWKEQTQNKVEDFIEKVNGYGFSRIIHTCIDRDGTKQGPNIDFSLAISKKTRVPVIISGGVSSLDDIKKIKEIDNSKIEGIIIGKAIYDGNIDLNELSKLI